MNREEIWALARSVYPFAVEARRHLHQYPELSFQEKESSAYVATHLRKIGYEVQEGIGGYGLKAVLQGAAPGRTIGLRADMDALPITEGTGLPFASEHPGVMHACGHDVHTATLLATAQAMKGIQEQICGQVVFLFQPGEEMSPGGASLMIKDGVLQNPTIDAIFGLHIFPFLEVGRMTFGAGPKLAAPDEFNVTVRGRGGHGAAPHLTVDPVMVACQIITLLQQIVARQVSPFQSAVITVGIIRGGTARNVIPDTVTFEGTVRTMEPELQRMMPQRIEQIVKGVCDAAGASYEFRYEGGYPVLVNDPVATDIARAAAGRVLREENIGEMLPSMGGEDFAFYLQKIPGSFARLGATVPGTIQPSGLHTATLMVDERCMEIGVAYYLSLVQEFMTQSDQM